jgi:ElaB/YqjD/DUF883 family membrane-anchored ribosome-binding protein
MIDHDFENQSQGSTAAANEKGEQDVTMQSLQQQFQTVAGEVKQLARLVRDGARDALSSAGDRAGDMGSDAHDRAEEAEERAAEWIRERPFQAAFLSMGAGAILWSLMKR